MAYKQKELNNFANIFITAESWGIICGKWILKIIRPCFEGVNLLIWTQLPEIWDSTYSLSI